MTDKTTGIALMVAVIFGILVLALANSGWLQGLGIDSVTTEHIDATNGPTADYCVLVDSFDTTQFEFGPCDQSNNAIAYAELYVSGGASSQTFGAAFTKLTQWTTLGDNRDMTGSAASDDITAVLPGTYLLVASASLTGTVSTTFTAQAFLDGVALPGIASQIRADGTEHELTIAGLVALSANQVVDIRVQASPPSSALLVKDGVFALTRLVSAVGGAGGLTSLNGQTGGTQTFADVDDTNITLAIGSAANVHTFTVGWAGILAVVRGGTGSAPAGDDQALISDSSSAATWRTLPNCGGATTDKLLYTQASNSFSCGVDQVGAGGGDAVSVNGAAATDANFIDGDIDFTLDTGPAPDTIAATVGCTDCVALATETTGAYVATITAPAAGITVSGVGAENATAIFALADDLGGLEGMTLTGTVERTAANTWTARAPVNDGVYIGSNGPDWTTSVVPNCASSNQALQYTQATGAFSCGAVPDQAANYIWTGTHDFGAAPSVEIPNGASPTVDADGEVAVDITDDQFLYQGDTATRVLTHKKTISFLLESPADPDNFLIKQFADAVTLLTIDCIIDPADTAESVVVTVQERNSTGDSPTTMDAITCDNDGAVETSFTDSGMAAAGWMSIDIGTVTGTVTQVVVTIQYTLVRE